MWESWQLLNDGQQFTVQNVDQLYVLVSSAHKTTWRDITCTDLLMPPGDMYYSRGNNGFLVGFGNLLLCAVIRPIVVKGNLKPK